MDKCRRRSNGAEFFSTVPVKNVTISQQGMNRGCEEIFCPQKKSPHSTGGVEKFWSKMGRRKPAEFFWTHPFSNEINESARTVREAANARLMWDAEPGWLNGIS